MRHTCSVCHRTEGYFFNNTTVTKIDGVGYCQDCYRQRFGHLDAHPIPDSIIKGITGLGMEVKADPEFTFWEYDKSHKIKIHRFMYYPTRPNCRFDFDTFLGMDLYSGKPVYVYYSEDDTASDGGPSALTITPLTDQQFSNVLSHYPMLVREKFTGFCPETAEQFRDMTVTLDMNIKAFTLMQECYDHIRLIRYCWNNTISYAEVPKETFKEWRSGKDPLECASHSEQLLSKAFWAIQPQLCPKILKKWKTMEQLMEDCFAFGTEVPLEQANLIRTEGYSRKLGMRNVPAEKLNQLFAYLQSIFPKQFAARPNR